MMTKLVEEQGTHVMLLSTRQIQNIGLSEQKLYYSKESSFLNFSFVNKAEWLKSHQVS